MSDEKKCQICQSDQHNCRIDNLKVCDGCISQYMQRDNYIIEKLFSRIEQLEQDNKDLNESYQGLAAELRFVMQKIEKLEQENAGLLHDNHNLEVENERIVHRLEKLEDVWGQVLNPESYVQLKARIEKLEQKESINKLNSPEYKSYLEALERQSYYLEKISK